MKDQDQVQLIVEELEDRIAPTGLGACLSTAPPSEHAHAGHHNVAAAALAASGHGVVTVTEGLCP